MYYNSMSRIFLVNTKNETVSAPLGGARVESPNQILTNKKSKTEQLAHKSAIKNSNDFIQNPVIPFSFGSANLVVIQGFGGPCRSPGGRRVMQQKQCLTWFGNQSQEKKKHLNFFTGKVSKISSVIQKYRPARRRTRSTII